MYLELMLKKQKKSGRATILVFDPELDRHWLDSGPYYGIQPCNIVPK